MIRWSLVLLALVIHGGLTWISFAPEPRDMRGDERFYASASRNLQAGEESGLGALWPSLYPTALSWIGVPDQEGNLSRAYSIQVLLLAAAALLLRDLFQRLVAPGLAADVAGFLFFAYPPLAVYAYALRPEILHLGLLMGAAWILTARNRSLPWIGLLGVILGLALSTKCFLGPFLPILLAPLFLPRACPGKKARLAMVAACCAVTLLPFYLEGLSRSNNVGTCASSARFNLWVGLLDTARRSYEDPVAGPQYRAYLASSDSPAERHQILGEKIRQRVMAQGIFSTLGKQLSRQPFRFLDKDTLLTHLLPGGILEKRGGGFAPSPFWLTPLFQGTSYLLYAALGIGTCISLFAFPPGPVSWKWLLATFLAYHSVLLLVVHVKARFRLSLIPVAIFLTLWAIHQLIHQAKQQRGQGGETWKLTPRGWLLASATSLTFLFLAFGGNYLP